MLLLPARLWSHRLACLPSLLSVAGGRLGVDLGSAVSSRLSCEQFYFLPSTGLFHWLLLLSVARLLSSKCPVPGAALRGSPGNPEPAGRSPEPAEPRATHAPGGSALQGGPGRLPRNVIAAGGMRVERGRPRRRRWGGRRGRAGQGRAPPRPPIAALPFSPAGSRRPAAAAAGTAAGAARAGSFWTSPP